MGQNMGFCLFAGGRIYKLATIFVSAKTFDDARVVLYRTTVSGRPVCTPTFISVVKAKFFVWLYVSRSEKCNKMQRLINMVNEARDNL